ncbi:hypothetical protein E4P38_04925 [Blastococcus sp. CT_GayMR16]|nr:hypothetical protein E4P38_04925 [Blastococcus sp. CT_GayMR16]
MAVTVSRPPCTMTTSSSAAVDAVVAAGLLCSRSTYRLLWPEVSRGFPVPDATRSDGSARPGGMRGDGGGRARPRRIQRKHHRLTARLGTVIPVVMTVLSGVHVASAAAPPSISTQIMIDTDSVDTDELCDPGGISTVSFTASGTATGTYSGPFTASGSYQIGPQVMPGGSSSNELAVGPLLSFDETFSIDSPAGTIRGTTTLKADVPADFSTSGGPINSGACSSFADHTLSQVTGASGTLNLALAYVAYDATITGPGGKSQVTGDSFMQVNQQHVQDSSVGPFVAGEFFELFYRALTTTPIAVGSVDVELDGSGAPFSTGDEATPDLPVVLTIDPPDGMTGHVSATRQPSGGPAPAGYALFAADGVDSALAIEGPNATTADPYVMTFAVDATLLDGIAPQDVQVFRNGAAVADCTGTGATPDPCVSNRSVTADGDAVLTVRTSRFSTWEVGRLEYTASGPFAPLRAYPQPNRVKPGSIVPVRFGLSGARGSDVLAAGYPKLITCAGTPVAVGASVLAPIPVGRGQYLLLWATPRRASGCHDLVLRFRDGDELRARFDLR